MIKKKINVKYKLGDHIYTGYTYTFDNEFYLFNDGLQQNLTFVFDKERRAIRVRKEDIIERI